MNKLSDVIIENEPVTKTQTYGIQEAVLDPVNQTLTGHIYGHPLFKDGDKMTFSSKKYSHWKVGDDEYFESAEGIIYRTFEF